MKSLNRILAVTACVVLTGLPSVTQAQAKKPNILVIWGDDIGQFNVSAYNRGMMGYRTPNIDRIAKEGVEFTDFYAQQSCTAGRAAMSRYQRLRFGYSSRSICCHSNREIHGQQAMSAMVYSSTRYSLVSHA